MKNTLPILYNGGSYGTYLQWLLDNLCHIQHLVRPFTEKGTSHAWHGQHLSHLNDINGWRSYVQSSQNLTICRLHPKTSKTHDLAKNIEEILQSCHKTILLYPSRNHEIMCMNRYVTKPWDTDSLFDGPLQSVEPRVLYDNWPITAGTSMNQLPRWIIREFLSFYLVPAWRDQVQWYLPDDWHHPRCLVIYTEDILYDPKVTLERIRDFCSLRFVRDIESLMPFHHEMLSLQTLLSEDRLLGAILESLTVQDDKHFSWSPLSLTSESWLQWALRQQGIELACDGLNDLPTNAENLKKYFVT